MSFLKKALLTVAITAVSLSGTVVAPSPASAASTGTLAFSGSFYTPPIGAPLMADPNSGGAYLDIDNCANAVATTVLGGLPAGMCVLAATGSYGASAEGIGGYCGLGGGTMTGYVELSNSHYYSFNVAYEFVGGTFRASGTAYGHATGETGHFTIIAVAVTLGDLFGDSCLSVTRRAWPILGTAQFQAL